MNSAGSIGLRAIVERVIPKSRTFRQMPQRVTDDVLAILVRENLAFTASRDPFEAAKDLRNAQGRIVILPLEHRVDKGYSDDIVKKVSPHHYLNIDSRAAVRSALEQSRDWAHRTGKSWGLPDGMSISDVTHLTTKAAQLTGMYPFFQVQGAMNTREAKPPIGFYWTGPDSRKRVVTWMRAINGHELFAQYTPEDSPLKMDRKFYAKHMKFTVPSRTHSGKIIDFSITPLPAFTRDDRRQYSSWRRLETTDTNSDAIYRGMAHSAGKPVQVFFTAYSIWGYDAAAKRLRDGHELGPNQIQINPFPMLTDYGRELLKVLREQTIVARRGPNMTEMDRLLGADAKNSGYEKTFVHWTKT